MSPLYGQSADTGSTESEIISAPVRLPYGVEDVLKLSRANVAEDTVVSYVQNSGTTYSLSANDVVYLRQQGISDRVISAMLEKKRTAVEVQAGSTAQERGPAGPAVRQETAPVSAEQPAPSPQPAPVYVTPPATPPASTVYVVPYPQASAAYYGYYPYYRPYSYWGRGPSISLGFRFGGGYHHHHHGNHHGFYGWRR